jgi:superoxide dismutase, Fe-Mn family
MSRSSTVLDRRSFLATGAAAAGLLAAGSALLPSFIRADAEYALAPLPYPADALEPHIDAETMKIHHERHHGAYVKNLNAALAANPDLQKLTLEELISTAAKIPDEKLRRTIVNNGGGHANHVLFWNVLAPNAGGEPKGKLAEAIKSTFGDVAKFQAKIVEVGLGQFGSGWAWLVKTKEGKLECYSTANQDSPLMQGHTPIFGIDVWEHAYYLKYRNLRKDYMTAIWKIVNWAEVEKRFG